MGIFAHPDDEALAAGGVLAQHAAAGARTAVVTATWTPGTHRAEELAHALDALGAGSPRLLGYADHQVPESAPEQPRLCDAPLDEAIGRIVAHLREFQPDIVISHDPTGASGHPDHIRTHQIALLAAHAAGIAELHPQAGPAWTPSSLWLCAYPTAGAQPLGDLVATAGKRLRTVPDEMITTAVDVRPWIDRKQEAILAHRSEVARARSLPALLAGLPEQDRANILATEWFICYYLDPGRVPGHRVQDLPRPATEGA
ncbi:PIG-L deacetylase family protein [Streptomyces sp. NBC_00347]|uniref:PIG-L deacetylase family protein n=1 Tax=Streptomyces sp. NBC_00347 TaxID=2975721 RepID=UPI0022562669|nr:PIG-L deacetylase family protein [Streptomyces sp. NBC_00347]MCX5129898.1 PIG-L family deacetylase [Streptomyces sp. NBC_00347]